MFVLKTESQSSVVKRSRGLKIVFTWKGFLTWIEKLLITGDKKAAGNNGHALQATEAATSDGKADVLPTKVHF